MALSAWLKRIFGRSQHVHHRQEAAATPTIKLMADYECWPLWVDVPGGTDNIDPADLPISKGLRDRLYEWADIFDSRLNWDDPGNSFPPPAEQESFVQQGNALGAELQAELGDAYRVVVHDQ